MYFPFSELSRINQNIANLIKALCMRVSFSSGSEVHGDCPLMFVLKSPALYNERRL